MRVKSYPNKQSKTPEPEPKMTHAQAQKYCDLVAGYRARAGNNPDASKIAELGKKARRLA